MTNERAVELLKEWKIDGYAGFSDYDDKRDYNFHHHWFLDDAITQNEVEAIIRERYKDKRVLVFEIRRGRNFMKNTRAMELLNEVINYVSIARDTKEQIEELVNMGFTTKELVEDFGYSLTDVEECE